MRVGRYGRQLPIRTHVKSKVELSQVTLVIEDEGNPLRGKMPLVSTEPVPVEIQAKRVAKVHSGPSESKRVKSIVRPDNPLLVSLETKGFYRVFGEDKVKGFVTKEEVDVVSTGQAYGVLLPSAITSRSELNYHIEVEDVNGNVTKTETVSIRLLTDEEIESFLAMYRGETKTKSPIYKKPLFWGGVAVAAIVAFLALDEDGGNGSDTATVDVLVEWE